MQKAKHWFNSWAHLEPYLRKRPRGFEAAPILCRSRSTCGDNHIINHDEGCHDDEVSEPCILKKKATFDRKLKNDLTFKAKSGPKPKPWWDSGLGQIYKSMMFHRGSKRAPPPSQRTTSHKRHAT